MPIHELKARRVEIFSARSQCLFGGSHIRIVDRIGKTRRQGSSDLNQNAGFLKAPEDPDHDGYKRDRDRDPDLDLPLLPLRLIWVLPKLRPMKAHHLIPPISEIGRVFSASSNQSNQLPASIAIERAR